MYQRILVPVDAGEPSHDGLGEAIRLALVTGAIVRPLHMLDAAAHANGFETGAVYCTEVQPAMRRGAERLLEAARARVEQAGLVAEPALAEVVAGRLADVVLEDALRWGADLIVVGSHGRRGLDRMFLGSEAEQIVRRSPVPVLVVRDGTQTRREDSAKVQRGGASTADSAAAGRPLAPS